MAEPIPEHREEARELERDELIEPSQRVWLHVYADTYCWCSYHFDERDDQHLTEYVHVDILSARDREIREVLEGLSGGFRDGEIPCWCFDSKSPHSPACLAAREVWERVQGEKAAT